VNAYLALFFGKPEELRDFAKEAMQTLNKIADGKVKRAESAAGITAVAFVTDVPRQEIRKRLSPLWRPEQRLWIIPVAGALMIDKVLMDWVRKHIPIAD
jgi:hypothetical protein